MPQDDDYSGLQDINQVRHLELRGCTRIDPAVWQQSALETLVLIQCRIESLPQEVAQLQALEVLEMRNCQELQVLPESLGTTTA